MKKLFLTIITLLALVASAQAKVIPAIHLYMGADSINISAADSVAFQNWYLSDSDNYFMKETTSVVSSLNKSYTSEDSLYIYQNEGTRSSVMAFPLSKVDSISTGSVSVPVALPFVPKPNSGSAVLVIKVPAGSVDCGGVGVVGMGFENISDWNPAEALEMQKLETDIPGEWYSVELVATESVTDIQCKVVGFSSIKEETLWKNQWGNASEVTILQADSEGCTLGNGPEPQLQGIPDASVVYIDIAGWQTAPCEQKNPAGTAIFTLKAENLPAEATAIQVVGNFDSDSEYFAWMPGEGLPLVKDEFGPWRGSCQVPEGFQYRYVWSADGKSWDYSHAMSRNDIQMDVHLSPIDVISSWKGGSGTPTPEGLTLDVDVAEISVGDALTLTAAGATDVSWFMDKTGIVDFANATRTSTDVVAIAEGSVTIKATSLSNPPYNDFCIVTVLPNQEPPLEMPNVNAPGAGSAILVVKVPAGSVDCGGVGVVGTGFENISDWNPAQALKMQKLETTVPGEWYAVELVAKGSVSEILCKVVGFAPNKADTGWSNQWGKDGQVSILQADGPDCTLGNGAEPQLQGIPDASVVYIEIAGWQTAPCEQKNPAGKATFVLTAENLPEGAIAIQVVGNFNADSEYSAWAPGKGLPLVKDEYGTWTGSCQVPADFQYKYVWSFNGQSWDWSKVMKGDNIFMPKNLFAEDTIVDWKNPNM